MKVQGPDGQVLDFPDDVSEGEILSFFKTQPAPQSAADKIAETVNYGVNRAGTQIVKGAAGLAGLPRMAGDALGWLDRQTGGDETPSAATKAGAALRMLPSGKDISDKFFSLTGAPEVDATGRPGKIVDSAIQGAVGGVLGRGPAAVRYATNALSGAGSEAAGQATQGTALELPARIAGALLAPTATGVAGSIRGTPATNFKTGLTGVSEEQIMRAEALMRSAEELGTPITGAEAMAQAGAPGANKLLGMQRYAEGSSAGGPQIAPMMQERPAANQAASGMVFDAIAPRSDEAVPLANRVEDAATTAIGNARKDVSNVSGPRYRLAQNDRVPQVEIEGLLGDLEKEAAADKTGIVGGVLRKFGGALQDPAGGVIDDIANLDRLRKFWRDRMELPNVSADALTREQSAAVGGYLDRLRTIMEKHSANFEEGRALHQQLSKELVDPMLGGQVGRLASDEARTSMGGAPSLKAQTGVLLPDDPTGIRPRDVGATVASLDRASPGLPRELVAEALRSRFAEAGQDTMAGANQAGGAKFAASVAGNVDQRANLSSAIENAAPGMSEPVTELLDVFRAQGKRLPVGSPTVDKGAQIEEMRGPLARALSKPAGVAGQIVDWWKNGVDPETVARVMTAPDSIAQMRRLAIEQPQEYRRLSFMASLLGTARAAAHP